VYAIDKAKKLTTIAKASELGAPNGSTRRARRRGSPRSARASLYALDAKGKKTEAQKLPKGSLDGIVALPAATCSSRAGRRTRSTAASRRRLHSVVENVKSPADIGYDTRRTRVLVPLFESNEVQAYEIK